jgi:hypothetical protein
MEMKMKRRTYLKAALTAMTAGRASAAGAPGGKIQLHLDLTVDPAKEKEMLRRFHESFKVTASKQPGYIDVQMLKLRAALKARITGLCSLSKARNSGKNGWPPRTTPGCGLPLKKLWLTTTTTCCSTTSPEYRAGEEHLNGGRSLSAGIQRRNSID